MLYPRLNYQVSFTDYLRIIPSIFGNSNKAIHFPSYFGTGRAYSLDYARTGLQLVLSLLPVGSKVGVQPLTCPTIPEAIEGAGCKVVFLDINAELCIDINDLKRKQAELSAVVVTHSFGSAAPVAAIRSVLGTGKLLIEDCAHSFLTTNAGEPVGQNGDFAMYSFGFGKFPTAIQGGVLVVNNPIYLEYMDKQYKLLGEVGVIQSTTQYLRASVMTLLNTPLVYTLLSQHLKNKKKGAFHYKKNIRSHRSLQRCPGFSLSLFRKRIRFIERDLSKQQHYYQLLHDALIQNPCFRVLPMKSGHNGFMVVALTREPERFVAYTHKAGIETGRHFVQSHDIIPAYGYQRGGCPVYENIIGQLVTLPSHYAYPSGKIAKLVKLIKNYK